MRENCILKILPIRIRLQGYRTTKVGLGLLLILKAWGLGVGFAAVIVRWSHSELIALKS